MLIRGNVGIRIINHSPVITIDSWDVHHSQSWVVHNIVIPTLLISSVPLHLDRRCRGAKHRKLSRAKSSPCSGVSSDCNHCRPWQAKPTEFKTWQFVEENQGLGIFKDMWKKSSDVDELVWVSWCCLSSILRQTDSVINRVRPRKRQTYFCVLFYMSLSQETHQLITPCC